MRALIAFLLLAAAAVTLALLFRVNTGYVLFVAPPYRVELSQNAFIIIAVVAFLALYALIRAAVRIAQMPAEVREGRRRRQFERFRSKQDAAVVALLEGRHGKARQFAEEALAIPQSSPVAALVGARSALETRDYAGASSMLDRPDTHATNLAVPRLMLEAEIALERGTRADQCRHRRRLRDCQRLLRELTGLAVTSLEQRDHGCILLAPKTFELPAAPPLADLGGHLRDPHSGADHCVQRQKRDHGDDDERVLRQLDAIRRCDEQHVAGVDPEQQRERHRRGGEQQER